MTGTGKGVACAVISITGNVTSQTNSTNYYLSQYTICPITAGPINSSGSGQNSQKSERSRLKCGAREEREMNGRSTRERATLPSAARLLARSAANGASEGHRPPPRHKRPHEEHAPPRALVNGGFLRACDLHRDTNERILIKLSRKCNRTLMKIFDNNQRSEAFSVHRTVAFFIIVHTRVQPFSMRLKMTWNVTVRSCIKSIAVEKISQKKPILHVFMIFSFSVCKCFLDLI